MDLPPYPPAPVNSVLSFDSGRTKHMKRSKNSYISAGFTAFAVIAASALLIFVIFRWSEIYAAFAAILKALQSFLIGSVLAYLLAPLCNRYEAGLKKITASKPFLQKRCAGFAVFLSALTALAIIAILLLLIVPSTLESLWSIIMAVPDYVMDIISWSNDKLTDYPEIKKYLMNIVDVVYDKFDSWTQNDLLPNVQTILSGVGSSITIFVKLLLNIVIGFIVSIYLLSSRRIFAKQAKMALYAALRPKHADMVYDEVKFADKMFSGFLRGKVLDSTIIAIICFIALSIMGVEDVMLISVIVGVTNIIPFFGPFIGAIPSALIIFISDPKQCLYFIIFILILQQFDGNILGPKCMGNNINLSPFWVLFAILLFGGLFNFVGMLIGVPLFAVIYDIIKKLVYYSLKKHGKQELLPANIPHDAPEITEKPEGYDKGISEDARVSEKESDETDEDEDEYEFAEITESEYTDDDF